MKNLLAKENLSRLLALLLALSMLLAVAACFDDEDYDYYNGGTGETAQNDGNTADSGGRADGSQASSLGGSAVRVLSFEPCQPEFYTNDPRLHMIEINQCLSYGFDTDTGEFYAMENFVAGKETAIFVTFSVPMQWANEFYYLAIERGGETVAELTPVILDDYTLYFQPKNIADVGNWEAGAYAFRVMSDAEVAVRTSNFYESTTLKVLAVPILANYSGWIVECEGEWKTGGTMLYATYPVAKAGIEFILGPELDLSDDMYDMDAGWDNLHNVWEALVNLQTPNKDYQLIIGFVRDNPLNGTLAGFTYGMPANIVTESDTDMLATVVHEIAHCYKIGDEYEGGHLNVSTNSPPYGMGGIDINSYEDSFGMKPSVIGGEQAGIIGTGSVIYPEQRAFWVEGRASLGAVTSYMGSGTGADSFTLWTTSDIWNHLFYVFTGMADAGAGAGNSSAGGSDGSGSGGSGNSGSGGGSGRFGQCSECYGSIAEEAYYTECSSCYGWTSLDDYEYTCDECGDDGYLYEGELYIYCDICWVLIPYDAFEAHNSGGTVMGRTTEPQTVNAIDITGYIDSGGYFVPTPWYTYETDSSFLTGRKSGDYGIHFYDAGGNAISSSYFDIRSAVQGTATDGTVSSPETDKTPVDVTVRFPENAAKIVIQRGGEDIYVTDVSPNAPVVGFTGLTDYQELSNKVMLTWEASDADGDELYFEIWYCPAEDEFYNVASNITGRSFEVDLSVYPGTHEGYFYIYATDGVKTSGIDSPWITVPYKAPEIITEQKSIPEVKITEEILLDVDIYDMQDGWLWSDEVVWTLDGKEFMSGSTLWVWPYEVAPGTHTFTCTATNSEGMSVSKEFTFVILDDESDLPDDWSREDIVNALSNGFVVSLNRIDTQITRGQYAALMSVVYGTVSDEYDPYPDYEENVVTDCGFDDYDQFLMVYLGVMDAPGGRFEPSKPVTQSEAAVILYRVLGMADPDIVDTDAEEADIVEIFIYFEIIDESGPNAYSAAANLTNRLALVRLSRLYEVLFE